MTTSSTTTGAGFDPRPFLKKLNGKDYLEVVHRLQWLRSEHPGALITTRLEHLDWEQGYAVFHARVEIPGSGVAEGTGSETRQGFPAGWLEKAETVAVGRALAMLGFGTAFALADFEEGHLADSPVETPAPLLAMPSRNGGALASPAQLKLMYMIAERDMHIGQETLEERCQAQYGRLSMHLTKREASEFIDSLKKAAPSAASR